MTHPILVTGAAGRVGGVGGLVVEALQRREPARPRHGAARGRARRGAVYRIRLPIRTVKVQESHLLAPGLRYPGTRSSKVCWNSPKPVTSRCAGLAGLEFAIPASAG